MMSQQKQITDFVISEFADLVTVWQFKEPLIMREDSMTRISYLHGGWLGVELELDWREFEMFILLVRLENSNLPKGYYVSNGRKCRKHLANVLREQKWNTPSRRYNERVSSKKTPELLQGSIQDARILLFEHLAQIVSKGESIFE